MSQTVRLECHSLWNSDLLTIPLHPLVRKAFLFRGCKIEEVTVFGVVVSVEKMKSVVSYYVDDGTGVILCALDESYAKFRQQEAMKLLDFHRDSGTICQSANMAFVSMLERAVDVLDGEYNLQQGDTVYLVGKISQYSEELRVVTISFICPLEDFRSEILLMELRSQFYQELMDSKGKVTKKSECSVTNDDGNNSDNENLLESFQRKYSRNPRNQTMDCCLGEWHEEYFMHEGANSTEFDCDDEIPD